MSRPMTTAATARHTPGNLSAEFGGARGGYLIRAGNRVIAETWQIDGDARDPEADNAEEEANARRIVRAVNAHDELLAALEECADAMQAVGYVPPCLDKARAAIAKARGE